MDYPKRLSLKCLDSYAKGVLVMRPGPFGNPYVIPRDGDRDEVIDKFEAYVNTNPDLIGRIQKELKGHNLICICGPKQRCHADILLKIANKEIINF